MKIYFIYAGNVIQAISPGSWSFQIHLPRIGEFITLPDATGMAAGKTYEVAYVEHDYVNKSIYWGIKVILTDLTKIQK